MATRKRTDTGLTSAKTSRTDEPTQFECSESLTRRLLVPQKEIKERGERELRAEAQ